MYDKQVVRRRRAVLALLVGLSIVLLTGYFGEGSGGFFHGLQRTAQAVLHPVEAGASRAFKPVRDLVNWTGNVFTANGENKRLKQELSKANALLAQAQTAVHDNGQVSGIASLVKASGFPQDARPVTSRVIAKSPNVWWSTITIDKGSDDGVHVDQPVVASGGLAGRVSQTTGGTAIVTLITDGTSNVSAEVVPDGANGVVTPAVGKPDDLRLGYIQKGRSIHQGDTVITSGYKSGPLESLFPRGVPIGRVTKIVPDELEQYQLVHLEPYADLRRMDYVQVLTGGRRTSQASTLRLPATVP
ncbi:MAG: rod shape-determining protein MreC [Thermoleophilaceae bacterium]